MISSLTKRRVIVGQVLILVSVVFVAISLGFVPDRQAAIVAGRVSLCEVLAINAAEDVRRRDLLSLENKLADTLHREGDMQSIRLLGRSGAVALQLGTKQRSLLDRLDWIKIPIWDHAQQWGELQVGFVPHKRPGLIGWLFGEQARFILGLAGLAYLAFYLYLSRVFNYLDPSKAVPERVRSALDALAGGVVLIDRRGQIVLVNRAFASCVEVEAADLQGRALDSLPWVTSKTETCEKSETCPPNRDKGRDTELLPWEPCLKDRVGVQRQTLRLRLQDGEQRTLLVGATAVVGEDGLHRGALVGLEDVTDLERTREQLQHAKELADAANQAKTQFLAGMSHEIRTPMNAVIGFADALRRGMDESAAERDEYLDIILRNGNHLLHLINDILDLSKIEAGKIELESVPFSPIEVANDVFAVFQRVAAEKGILLECEVVDPLPTRIINDVGRFRQVLTNLVGNAVKFTEAGSVVVRFACLRIGQQDQLTVDVEDTGIGMSPAAQARIFDAFAQADATVTRRFGGTGLGVPIARDLARAMGGDLTVSSREGYGTTFTARIDVGSLGPEVADISDPSRSMAKAADTWSSAQPTSKSSSLAGRVILVADDGAANRKLVSLHLRRAGAKVDQAVNGAEALELTQQNQYDVVLMDMQMPVMDGLEATQRLRNHGFDGAIVALTANAMKGERERCLAAGCTDFLTKPLNADQLLWTVTLVSGDRTQDRYRERSAEAGSLPSGHTVGADERLRPRAEETQINRLTSGLPTGAPLPSRDRAESVDGPIYSSLPLDDEEFCEIINDYLHRLSLRINEMEVAFDQRDYVTLDDFAHWLKGSGGTAGFKVLTDPAARLEAAARAEDHAEIGSCLQEIAELGERLQPAKCV